MELPSTHKLAYTPPFLPLSLSALQCAILPRLFIVFHVLTSSSACVCFSCNFELFWLTDLNGQFRKGEKAQAVNSWGPRNRRKEVGMQRKRLVIIRGAWCKNFFFWLVLICLSGFFSFIFSRTLFSLLWSDPICILFRAVNFFTSARFSLRLALPFCSSPSFFWK